MTDRVHSLLVVLGKDIRTDDVETLIEAIKLLKPVISVKANVADIGSAVSTERAKHELKLQIINLVV